MPLEYPIDHYVCYQVLRAGRPRGGCILEDQFDRHQQHVEQIGVLRPAFFGVPVSKNGEKIVDPDTHLAIYLIQPTMELRPQIRVTVLDQFHPNLDPALNLVALKSAMLAVPSRKLGWTDDLPA